MANPTPILMPDIVRMVEYEEVRVLSECSSWIYKDSATVIDSKVIDEDAIGNGICASGINGASIAF